MTIRTTFLASLWPALSNKAGTNVQLETETETETETHDESYNYKSLLQYFFFKLFSL